MQNTLEKGRSMIEMLGVLSIVGVISLGGLKIVGQFQSNLKSTEVVNNAVDLARQARKMARQFDSAYSGRYAYNTYLYKNNAYPKSFTFNGNQFTDKNGVVYWIDTGSGWFVLDISNLSDEYCMKLATNDWGTAQSSGVLSVVVNGKDGDGNKASNELDVTTTKFNLTTATDACSKSSGNNIRIRYSMH